MEEKQVLRQAILDNTLEEVKAARNEDVVDRQIDACVICLDSVTERAVAFPCRHYTFDFLCLLSWLEEQSTCPLCKAEVKSLQYNWKSPGNFQVYDVVSDAKQKSTHFDNDFLRHTSVQLYPRGRRRLPPTWRTRGPRHQQVAIPDDVLLQRRHIYRHKLYSRHVGSNRLSRFRGLTPAMVAQDAELVSKARKWIRRELQVFDYLSSDVEKIEGQTRKANNAEFLLEYIIAVLKTVDIKGSGGLAEDMLQDFLGRDNTRLFLHELCAYLRSPYNSLEDWDRHVQYGKAVDTVPGPNVYHPTSDHNPFRGVGVTPHESRLPMSKRPCDRYRPYQSHRPSTVTQRLPSDAG